MRNGTGYVVVRAAEIVWFEGADNHVRIHSRTQSYLLRTTLSELERTLDPRLFLRIHRSVIISIDEVRTIDNWGHGEHLFVLHDGTRLTSSRRYRAAVRAAFGV
ncbi:MAG TPA: LytTR family DNA-binding domain-containing protein [Longimicrobium sp.]|nr:LytTR family DNA-binding domain-containing protein [Longimicrobium sp.]